MKISCVARHRHPKIRDTNLGPKGPPTFFAGSGMSDQILVGGALAPTIRTRSDLKALLRFFAASGMSDQILVGGALAPTICAWSGLKARLRHRQVAV
jgi:hypothetical protein